MMRALQHEAPPDYYSVLGVTPRATPEEIRASFKRLVLEAHPDKNPGRRDWSERRVRELIAAFDVLGATESRADFDRERERWATAPRRGGRATASVEPFFFRKSDPESRALLILHYLLHKKPRAALRVLKEMEARCGKDFLCRHLDREDYLDVLFLIGEFHTKGRDYLKAAERLETFYDHEKEARFPRHYFSEVIRLLKDLYLRKIPRSCGGETALRGLRIVERMHLTPAEECLRLTKMAEILRDAGRFREAGQVVDRACTIFPLSKSLEKIRKSIERAG
ncbi:MAG TPA: J domain-containing protein [Planctomycetota bacterium]|nr:J domain-containing protein [Planctomycetota bacterium]